MEEISRFRGMSGEVVRGFLKAGNFLTLIPILVFWIVFYVILYFVARNIPNSLFMMLNLIAAAMLVSRFAIPASRGEINAGIFNNHIEQGESIGFVLRYVIYTLIWFIPTSLLAHYVLNTNTLFGLALSSGSFSYAGASIYGLLAAILSLITIFAPILSFILSTETQSVGEVLSLEPLEWLYHERRWDLGPFFASAIGGMLIFYAKYLVPLFIIDMILFKISFEAGMGFSFFMYILPLLASPILIGRLCGAFVAGEKALTEDSAAGLSPNPSPVQPNTPNPGTASATAPQPQDVASITSYKKEYEELMKKLDQLNEKELTQAIFEAEKYEPKVYPLLALSYLYKKSNDKEKALTKAKLALRSCLDEGMSFEAVQLFNAFATEKTKLNLQKPQLLQLAPHLMKHKHFTDAAWCYLLVMTATNDEDDLLGIQKKYLNIANDASTDNRLDIALKLYDLFVKQYPNSTLIEFVKEAQANTQSKLDNQGN